MSDIAKIKDKIAKLREMTSSPNPNEASIALEKMHNLLMEYNLSESEIVLKSEIMEESYVEGKAERVHESHLVAMIARYNLCGTYRKLGLEGGRKTFKIMIVGKEHNMVACRVMCDYVFEAMERGAKALKGAGRETVFAYKKSFCLTLIDRIRDLKDREDLTPNNFSKDLVVREDLAVKNHLNAKNLKKGPTVNPNVKDMVGFLRGQLDAKNLSLNAQIMANVGNKPRLVV